MPRFKLFNIKGDLFATVATFGAQVLIKFGSSLVLTRILSPAAYGTIAILMSVIFVLVMLSDLGFSVCIVRSPRGDEQSYLNTAWTIRIVRALTNATIVFLAAPLIADLYHAPALTLPFRVTALWFVIDGLESTAFPIAVRRKNSRIPIYTEFVGGAIGSAFTLVYCYYSRDFWGMLYGALLNRLVVVAVSHRFYRDIAPRFQWDWAAAKEIFEYTRFVMPSSILTLVLNQFDKVVFLRLFDLNLLGVYTLGGNIASPVESLIVRASQMVLYPRCAHNFRTNKDTFLPNFYFENVKLYALTLAIPAAIGGAAHLFIKLLYDPRYAEAAEVLQAFMIRAVLRAFSAPAEDMLIATGESRLILVGNVYRLIWILGISFLGYHFYGFLGFTYAIALMNLPQLGYYFWLQHRKGFLIPRYEVYKAAFASAIAVLAYLASGVFLTLWPAARLKFKV